MLQLKFRLGYCFSLSEKIHSNKYATLIGLLCIAVVYMHSGWVGGFDIYTFGIDLRWLRSVSALLLMSVVPAFFILWGYLSNKYFRDYGENQFSLKKKLIQFYPLYLLVFICHLLLNFKNIENYSGLEIVGGVLGVYYRPGFYGGNIYLVVFFVLLTISLVRLIPCNAKMKIICFAVVCLVATKFLPHESTICYIKYFGYYSAFFLGVALKEYNFFENVLNNMKEFFFLLCFASLVPILNFIGIYFVEIQYLPNSPEQLLFVVALIALLLKIIVIFQSSHVNSCFSRFLNKVGSRAYFHFMVHVLVLHSISFLLGTIFRNIVVVQLGVIFLTSYVTVFLVYPVYILCSKQLDCLNLKAVLFLNKRKR